MIFETIENVFLIEIFSIPGAFLRWVFYFRKKGVTLKSLIKEKGMKNFWIGFIILFPIELYIIIYFNLFFRWY